MANTDPIAVAAPTAGAPQQDAATLSALYGVGQRLREYTISTFAQRKPWREMFERSAFAWPANVGEAAGRLQKNAAYFRVNYLALLLGSVALTFLTHPASLFVLAALLAGWVYVFAIRTAPITISGRDLSEREKLLYMSGGSLAVVFFLTNVASLAFSALATGAALAALHGALRVPDDLFVDGESNQSLLGILTGGAQPAGASNV